jgi:hypothetical protein
MGVKQYQEPVVVAKIKLIPFEHDCWLESENAISA